MKYMSALVNDLNQNPYTSKQLMEYGVDASRSAAFQWYELPVHIEESSVEEKCVVATFV